MSKKNALLLVLICISLISSAQIEKSGIISTNEIWSADTIKITGNITINNGITLIINPGVYVEFQGHYGINVKGTVLAKGTIEDVIIFTSKDTLLTDSSGGWFGIRFDQTGIGNDTSIINHCILEYGNANSRTGYGIDRFCGGAIFVQKYNKVVISNNIIRRNYANYRGAGIYCYDASPVIVNNLIYNNKTANYGGGICSYYGAKPKIINNTIVNNYGYVGGIFCYASNPEIINNIIRGNGNYNIKWEVLDPVIKNCNIENFSANSNNNINQDPKFNMPGILPYNIKSSSLCINAGVKDMNMSDLKISEDILGNPRINHSRIDIGAFEFAEIPDNRIFVFENNFIDYVRYDNTYIKVIDLISIPEDYSLTLLEKPDGMSINSDTLEWTPSFNHAAKVYNITILIENTIIQDTLSFKIHVLGNNEFFHLDDSDVVWDYDTVKIYNDLVVNNEKTLTIKPRTFIEFQGEYSLNVRGRLIANGKVDSLITFTAKDTTCNLVSKTGGWGGIRFDGIQDSNDTTIINYCILEFTNLLYNFNGALYINDFDKVILSNNIIRNNIYGITLIRSSPLILNNVVINNISLPIYMRDYSYPVIVNNTVADNGSVIYVGTDCHPVFHNSIIWGNNNGRGQLDFDPSADFDFSYCDIQNEVFEGIGNKSIKPKFAESGNHPFNLSSFSPCINGGNPIWTIDSIEISVDILGNDRINFGRIDIGAYEYSKYNGINHFWGLNRSGAVSFVIDSCVYIGLGNDNDSVMCNFWKYDLATDLWNEIVSFPGGPRTEAVSFVIDGKAYVGLGRSNYPYTYYKDFYEYNPITDQWTQIANFSGTARYNAVAFAIDSDGFVGTGTDEAGELRDFWKYNQITNSWTQVADMSGDKRAGAVAFTINNKAYVSGGQYFDGYSVQLSDVQEYNPATNTWQEKIFADGINLSFSDAASFVMGDKGYICYGNKQTVVSYDPVTNEVVNYGDILNLADKRFDPVAFMLDSTIYFGLGYYGVFTPVYQNDILELNHLPVNITLSQNTINENTPQGTLIGVLNTSDADVLESYVYSLVTGNGSNDADNGSFTINGSELVTNTNFDFEAQNQYSVYIQTKDVLGATFRKEFIIYVNDINESPTDQTLSANTINENTASGTVIGLFSTTDEDADDTHSYSLVTGNGSNDADNSFFTISGNELRNNEEFNFENKNQYSIYVKTEDQNGQFLSKSFVIGVIDENEIPTNINLSSNTIDEKADEGTLIGIFSTTDEDVSDTHIYSLVPGNGTNDADNMSFTIDGNELKTAIVFDYETKQEYHIYVQTKDINDLSYAKAFVITVTDVAETGIFEDDNNRINIYPNPTKGLINIELNETIIEETRLEVLNSAGQVVYSYKLAPQTSNHTINIGVFSKGVYYLIFQGDDSKVINKIILE
ncbi:MAG: choice-of-anchor Q domain-containing protein [Bacteroidales bacterium]|jgi:N-acetylneuraminic acid mutarotase|nr:choice-of-anchor Q domain-containing protein [Bacteroidales bacterium]